MQVNLDAFAGSPPARDCGRVGFIGAGRVGQALAQAFARAGVAVAAVSSRSLASAQALAQPLGAMGSRPLVQPQLDVLVQACDTVFITVQDDHIADVAQALPWRPGLCVVHCSGATELDALLPAAAAGSTVAGFHPLHTFGDVATALATLPGSAVAVESPDPQTAAGLAALARRIGMRPFELPPGSRALYHASAHYAGSFVVTLMAQAVQHWARFGVPPEQALQALVPLLQSTVKAIEAQGVGAALAGVVARGDQGVLARHLQALAEVGPAQRQLYADLSLCSLQLARATGRLNDAQAQALQALLSAPPSAGGR
jgi:predicted short-subunit dehydrogenase-like oxidoreductase (DUF2520 family)